MRENVSISNLIFGGNGNFIKEYWFNSVNEIDCLFVNINRELRKINKFLVTCFFEKYVELFVSDFVI